MSVNTSKLVKNQKLTTEWREQNPGLISGKNSAKTLLDMIKLDREKSNITSKHGSKKKKI